MVAAAEQQSDGDEVSVNNQDQAGDLLIQEVDEDLRRDHYLKLWRLYGKYAIGGVVAIVLGVAGHQFWLTMRERQFQSQAARFAVAGDLATAGKTTEAIGRLAEIADDKGSGFALVAGFQRAEMQIEAGDETGALASLEQLAHTDAQPMFRDLAVLKIAMLTLDKDDAESLAKRLQPLADPNNVWHLSATELLALLANRRGDNALASKYYKQLADDAAAPQDIRSRASEMLALMGDKPEKG